MWERRSVGDSSGDTIPCPQDEAALGRQALDGTSAPARCQLVCHSKMPTAFQHHGRMPTASQCHGMMPTMSLSHGRTPTLPLCQGSVSTVPGLLVPSHSELVPLAASGDITQNRPWAPAALRSPIPPSPSRRRKRGKN